MPVPYTFATATTAIPLSQLDNNFATAITLGNTAIQLGNTVTTLNNMTLANVTISSGTVSITNVAVTTANVSGTANISTLVVVGNSTMGGNVSVGGNVSISVNTSVSGNASVTGNVSAAGITASSDLTLSGGTANGVLYLNGSKVATSGSALTFDGTNLGVNSPILAARTLSVKGRAAFTATANDSQLAIYSDGSTNGLYSTYNSTGSYLPMAFFINDAEAMRLTSTGLGIGTSSPVEKVQSSKGIAATGANQSVGSLNGFVADYSSGASRLFASRNGVASSTLEFWTTDTGGAANKNATLDSSGNFGLGVTPSGTTRMQVLSSGNNLAYFQDASAAGVTYAIATNGSGQIKHYATWANSGVDAYHSWYVTTTAGAQSQAMTLDASGRLGVGTTSPSQKLHVYQSGGANILLDNGGASTTYFATDGFASGVSSIYTNGSAPLAFGTNSTERARISSDGTFNIGTTTGVINDGNLVVAGSIGTGQGTANTVAQINIWETTSGNKAGLWFGAMTNSNVGVIGSRTASGAIAFQTYNSGWAERARIDSSGNLLVGTTSAISAGKYSSSFAGATENGIILQTTLASTGSTFIGFVNSSGSIIGSVTQNGASTVAYNTSSDYRLKNTVAPMTGALAKVAQLKPCTYKWNSDGSNGQGFIAHELAEVVPECVSGEKDAVDAEGNPVYQGIDTSFLVATLTAAIQEQQALIQQLTARVAQLESN